MKITGTFLDEISHDIPHQNWGEKEWDRDFATMRSIGIDTVILIRCGHKRFITYPSKSLMELQHCYCPPVDLVELFLSLADKYAMKFFFGLYDSGLYWHSGKFEQELDLSRRVAEEVWTQYGHHPSFGGWYLNFEMGKIMSGIADIYRDLGKFLKAMSGNLPIMISPYICGHKAVGCDEGVKVLTLEEHEHGWDDILSGIRGAVDIVAFQDGHCDYSELADFIRVNKSLTDRYGMTSWTNCESFDRDMPINFLPIKWEKMKLKLDAAEAAGIEKAITFEFSHFMSPHSMYNSAHGLFDRYCEYAKISR